jgi:UDP-N-acetylmuramoylalanine--D-glutamate ligase
MTQHHRPKLTGEKIVVVGLGVSGLWTARYLVRHGARVTVSEMNREADLDPAALKELHSLGVTLETGGHITETFLRSDMIVLSPGVPHDIRPVCVARDKGVPVTGELELAARLIDTPIIAVTGTNGKSTVTTALGSILENSGLSVFVGGNIGTPLMAYAYEEKWADYVVAEVSSFQLDTSETFSPSVAIVLNISPDHLDRYPAYEDYALSKLKIFKNQCQGQYAILNDDDERLASFRSSSGAMSLRYGFEKKKGRHAYFENNQIVLCGADSKVNRFDIKSYRLPGRHNLENLMAIVLAAYAAGIGTSVIQRGINGLKGLPHRVEHIMDFEGVAFYDDSKATNVDAAVRAVLSFDRPLILIAGGRHKGGDYTPLVTASQGKVRKAIFLGEARELLSASFDGKIPFSLAENMEEAVSMAFSCATGGDIVLLAPACSSFDMFNDYGHRGRVFKAAAERLGQ